MISIYLFVVSAILFAIETRVQPTRRTALHLLRYASALLHPSARGALYILAALALLSLDLPWVWPLGYSVEILGIATVFAGARVSSKLKKFRSHYAHSSASAELAVVAAFRTVSMSGSRPITEWGLKMLAQSAGVPLRYTFERVALLNTLDLDRDGKLTELDLLYWFTDKEDNNDDARGIDDRPMDEADADDDDDGGDADDGRGYGSAIEAFGGSAPAVRAPQPGITLERALDATEGRQENPFFGSSTPAPARTVGRVEMDPPTWQPIDGARTPAFASSFASDRV